MAPSGSSLRCRARISGSDRDGDPGRLDILIARCTRGAVARRSPSSRRGPARRSRGPVQLVVPRAGGPPAEASTVAFSGSPDHLATLQRLRAGIEGEQDCCPLGLVLCGASRRPRGPNTRGLRKRADQALNRRTKRPNDAAGPLPPMDRAQSRTLRKWRKELRTATELALTRPLPLSMTVNRDARHGGNQVKPHHLGPMPLGRCLG
jgi:hypothetical protein